MSKTGRHRGRVIGFLKTGVAPAPSTRLEAPRVYLRPPRPRDWRLWARLRGESRAFLEPWEPLWPPDALTRASFLRRLRRLMADWRHDEGYGFLIFRAEDEELVGGVSVTNVRRGVSQSGTLGYWLGAPYTRQGYMTEAGRAAVSFALFELGLHRIEAACLPSNKPSRALLARVGFVEEGLARAYLMINGRWRDHLTYSLLREDWVGDPV